MRLTWRHNLIATKNLDCGRIEGEMGCEQKKKLCDIYKDLRFWGSNFGACSHLISEFLILNWQFGVFCPPSMKKKRPWWPGDDDISWLDCMLWRRMSSVLELIYRTQAVLSFETVKDIERKRVWMGVPNCYYYGFFLIELWVELIGKGLVNPKIHLNRGCVHRIRDAISP